MAVGSVGPGGAVIPGYKDRALHPPSGLDVVVCSATAKLDFSNTPLAWGVFWTPTLHAQAEALPPPFRQLIRSTREPFLQAIVDLVVPRMALGRVALVGDAAVLPRPHTAASASKAAADALALVAG